MCKDKNKNTPKRFPSLLSIPTTIRKKGRKHFQAVQWSQQYYINQESVNITIHETYDITVNGVLRFTLHMHLTDHTS